MSSDPASPRSQQRSRLLLFSQRRCGRRRAASTSPTAAQVQPARDWFNGACIYPGRLAAVSQHSLKPCKLDERIQNNFIIKIVTLHALLPVSDNKKLLHRLASAKRAFRRCGHHCRHRRRVKHPRRAFVGVCVPAGGAACAAVGGLSRGRGLMWAAARIR